MNKVRIAEMLDEKPSTIDYSDGTLAQQKATVVTIAAINTAELEDTIPDNIMADALYGLQKDVQVRDYVMGVILGADEKNNKDLDYYKKQLALLTDIAPDGYKDAPMTLLSLVHYVQGEADTAVETLKNVSSKYPLSNLLRRVYGTHWPVEALVDMAKELHPRVVAGIFGEDTNVNSLEQ